MDGNVALSEVRVMSCDTNSNHDGPRKRPLSAIVIAFAVFVVYPLSVGPFVWYKAHAAGAIQTHDLWFYRPLFWLAEQSNTAATMLNGYLEFFFR